VIKFKVALKVRRYNDISQFTNNCRLHMPSSKHRTSANVSSKSTITGFSAYSHKKTISIRTAWMECKY